MEGLRNPIDGSIVDEVIKEAEARQRGYFDLEFILKYLEDDNEFVKFFIIEGKRVVVDIAKPYLQYKKPTQINHERVLSNVEFTGGETKKNEPYVPKVCTIDNQECEACGS